MVTSDDITADSGQQSARESEKRDDRSRLDGAELERRAVGLTCGRAVVRCLPHPLAGEYAALLGLRRLISVVNRHVALAAQNWSGAEISLSEQIRALLAECDPWIRAQIFAALQELLPTLVRLGESVVADHDALRRVLEDGAVTTHG